MSFGGQLDGQKTDIYTVQWMSKVFKLTDRTYVSDDENPREVVGINRLQIMTISDEKCKDCYGFTTISMEPYGAHNN